MSSDVNLDSPDTDIGLGNFCKNDSLERETDWENFDKEKVRELQLADPVLEKLQVWKGSEKKPKWCEIVHQGLEIKYYWHRWQLLCLREDVLYRR